MRLQAENDALAASLSSESLLTVPEVQALLDALGRYADALDDPQDGRTRAQKMADCLLDLVLRPGEQTGPPVQARLTVVAGVRTLAGGDEPGEIGREPVPAEMVRALARENPSSMRIARASLSPQIFTNMAGRSFSGSDRAHPGQSGFARQTLSGFSA